jgi:hypothetical protein
MATIACAVVLATSVILGLRPGLIAIQIATLSGVMLFLWTRPTARR